ncbi:nucleotidyl transferase AbiEii/AbiGii toxin family protein [Patescibacteria group bacterium]|nr:nucleotidyl transferase AbiEii/AbiGii toxin family protein [Patescibacteria group bacterium]
MDIQLAVTKARKLNISVVQIVREEYEMIILNRIFESPFGQKLVFRGGTTLRLAYNSPRFSDDLDFAQLKPIKLKEFQVWSKETAKSNPYMKLAEALKKKFTLFALFKIKDPALPAIISIKVEISLREEMWEKEKDYLLMRLKSEITPLTVLVQAASLKRIQKEKTSITPLRIRDIFDLWFIGQQLNEPYQMNFSGFKVTEVKRELNRLLSLGSRRMIEQWLPKS